MDSDKCTCGHVRDEHGGNDEAPSGTACNVEGCDCIAFEKAPPEEEEEHGGSD